MKAVMFERYGPPEVLKLVDIKKPIPKADEVLIKVMAATVSTGDWKMRKPSPFLARSINGLFKPRRIKILGFEISGIIEDVGKSVTMFKIGDKVFAFLGFKFGGYVQYKCMKENSFISQMPCNISFEEAAAVPAGASTALSFIRDNAKVKQNQKVLIYGASGSVGTYAVQLAKYFGADVTAVCSTDNVEMVRSLGADKVIDYKKEDFTDTDERYDLVFDAVAKSSKKVCRGVIKKEGRYISVHDRTSKITPKGLTFLRKLIEENNLRPVIDRIYNLEDTAKAHRYVEKGHKKGNVAISIKHSEYKEK